MHQAEKATARTKEEKVIAHERAKAKEAKAKMELHEAKARHAAEKLSADHPHNYRNHHPTVAGTEYQGHQQQPLGLVPNPVATHSTYPLGLGGNHLTNKHF